MIKVGGGGGKDLTNLSTKRCLYLLDTVIQGWTFILCRIKLCGKVILLGQVCGCFCN